MIWLFIDGPLGANSHSVSWGTCPTLRRATVIALASRNSGAARGFGERRTSFGDLGGIPIRCDCGRGWAVTGPFGESPTTHLAPRMVWQVSSAGSFVRPNAVPVTLHQPGIRRSQQASAPHPDASSCGQQTSAFHSRAITASDMPDSTAPVASPSARRSRLTSASGTIGRP